MTKDGTQVGPKNNVDVVSNNDPLRVEGVKDTFLAVAFAGPDNVRMKITRQGVSTAMLAALSREINAQVEVELSMKHQALLMRVAQENERKSIAVAGGNLPKIRGH